MNNGLNLTLRQLYYQFVAGGLLANTERNYKKLGSIINNARLAGYINWYAIEDRTRNLMGLSHWKNPGDIMKSVASSFKVDKWEGQKYRPEVWIEKEALAGVISSVCNELDVSYFACRGYVSQSEMWSASQRFKRYDATPIIIYLGDHDPSGIDMTRDIQDRQDMFGGGVLDERIALNMDQIDEYKPPPNPAKLTDTRASDYILRFGHESWELDALDPFVLQDLVRETVLKYRDENTYQEVIEQEDEYIKIIKNITENWEKFV